MTASEPIIAMLKASSTVRGGQWVMGAPSHVLPEFQRALHDEGYDIVAIEDLVSLLDAVDHYAAHDLGLDHHLHAIVEHYRSALNLEQGGSDAEV